MRTAIEIAAQIWCDPRCSDIEMDTRLAEVFAEEIQKLLDYLKTWERLADNKSITAYGIVEQEELIEKNDKPMQDADDAIAAATYLVMKRKKERIEEITNKELLRIAMSKEEVKRE